jgi:hypothetical protein
MKRLIIIPLLLLSVFLQGQMIFKANPFYKQNSIPSSLLTALVSYWNLNEATGTDADDAVGSNNGTTNATVNQTGISGKAFTFAAGTSVDCGSSTSLALSSAGTISAWIYQTTQSVTSAIAGRINFDSDRNGFILYMSSGNLIGGEIATASAKLYVGNTSLTADAWHHVVMTWNADSLIIYSDNGRNQGIANTLGSATDGSYNFYIGDSPLYASHFIGTIDEVAVWSRKLLRSEVSLLWNAGSGKFYPY